MTFIQDLLPGRIATSIPERDQIGFVNILKYISTINK